MSLTSVPDDRCLREGSEPGRVGPSRAERAEPNRAKRDPAFLWKTNARASTRVLPRARGQRLRHYVRVFVIIIMLLLLFITSLLFGICSWLCIINIEF